jgi:hypothetical protein
MSTGLPSSYSQSKRLYAIVQQIDHTIVSKIIDEVKAKMCNELTVSTVYFYDGSKENQIDRSSIGNYGRQRRGGDHFSRIRISMVALTVDVLPASLRARA